MTTKTVDLFYRFPPSKSDRTGWVDSRGYLVACHDVDGTHALDGPDGPTCLPDVFIPGEPVTIEVSTTPRGGWHEVAWGPGWRLAVTRASGEKFDPCYPGTIADALDDAPLRRLWVRRAKTR